MTLQYAFDPVGTMLTKYDDACVRPGQLIWNSCRELAPTVPHPVARHCAVWLPRKFASSYTLSSGPLLLACATLLLHAMIPHVAAKSRTSARNSFFIVYPFQFNEFEYSL